MSLPLGKNLAEHHWESPAPRVQSPNSSSCGAFALVAAVEALTGTPSKIGPLELWRWLLDNGHAGTSGTTDENLQTALAHFWPVLWTNRALWRNRTQERWVETLVHRSPFLLLTGSHWRTVTGFIRIKRVLWLGTATYLKIYDPTTGRETYDAAFKIKVDTVLQIRNRLQ